MKQNSKIKAALIYAQSLYEGALEHKCLEACYKNAAALKIFAQENADILQKINNPLYSATQKTTITDILSKNFQLNKVMLNCLNVIAQNRKWPLLEEIMNQFIVLYNGNNGIAEVDVTTAVDLSAAQDNLLKSKLSAVFGKKVIVNYIKDENIIGGLIIKCGSQLIDASVKNKLNALEKYMKGTK